jgi:uncharacterized protein (TIGR00730 family)
MTRVLESLCVFCGSSSGNRPAYRQSAESIGRLLAERGITLIYGGGNVGLMGITADACLAAGGRVVGVIPQVLVNKELAHRGLTELHVVGSMHERKARMAELAGAFLALPGGMGTFEEFFEIFTWAQLGLHRKAFGLLNVEGYYDALLAMADHSVAEGFVKPVHRSMLLSDSDPLRMLESLTEYKVPHVEKWIDRRTS